MLGLNNDMSFLINSFIFSTSPSPPDFSGYSISHIWMPVKTSEATIDYYARVSRNGSVSAGDLMYVFYDEWFQISMDSQVSSTTTADEDTTVREWFQDGATTDEYYIHTLYDQIGGVSLAHDSGNLTNAPLFAEDAKIKSRNLTNAFKFQNSATGFLRGSALSELGTGQDFSILSLSTLGTLGDIDAVVSTRDDNTGDFSRFNHYNRGDNANVVILRTTTPTTYTGSLTGTENNTAQKELVSTVENGGNLETYFNGSNTDTDAITGNFVNDTFDLGIDRGSVNSSNGLIQAVIVSNSVWGSSEVSSLRTLMDSVFDYSKGLNFVADGNSLTFGQGSTSGNEYPTIFNNRVTNQGTTTAIVNKSTGGQTTQQMEADATTDIDTEIDGGKRNILLAWEIRNDMIVNSLSVQDAYDNFVTYCTNRRAAGWEVIIATILPSWSASYKGDNTVTGYNQLNTDREAVNVLLRNNWQSFADGIVDFSLDPELDTFGNNEQSGYVFSTSTRPTTSDNGLYDDGTHLTNAGYAVVANMFFDELIKLMHR